MPGSVGGVGTTDGSCGACGSIVSPIPIYFDELFVMLAIYLCFVKLTESMLQVGGDKIV